MRDAGLHKYIAIEALQRARSRHVRQHAVTADASIDDGLERLLRRDESPCEHIRPAMVAIRLGDDAIGDRIAERDNHAGRLRVDDIDARQEARVADFALWFELGRRGEVAER